MEMTIEQLTEEFRKRFSSVPRLFRAPGRVNLIGEHTDYNDGFVMPFAIDRQTIVAAAPRDDARLEVIAHDLNEEATIDLEAEPIRERHDWKDYVEGTARCVQERFGKLRGANMIITSTVPIGGGLSSSAAIEISVGCALLGLNGIAVDKRELAFAAQQAEHEFVGTRSGIMDQFASVFSRRDHAMLLDCRSLDIEYIPIADPETSIAVIDTKVKHNLASSEYNERRRECEAGVAALQKFAPEIKSLRDVSPEMLDRFGNELEEVILRRCRHVVLENDRTLSAAGALRDRDLELAGKLMFESHRSLRDDYEVSCAELDFLVDTAAKIDGVFGSRMTGGGFGGCTVNLVRADSVESLRKEVCGKYEKRFNCQPDFYVFEASDGASEISAGDINRSPTNLRESRIQSLN